MVGLSGFEPLTSRLSAVRSSQLSYRPVAPLLNHGLRSRPRPWVSRDVLPKEPCPARRPSEWLFENWVDGFDYGENELGKIL